MDLPLRKHCGAAVLAEPERYELAVIPVAGERLQDCVVLHPRYVPDTVPHRKEKFTVYRRGRTIDLILDTPVVSDNRAYGIMTFKGVGAAADDDMQIDTGRWHHRSRGLWVPGKDRHGRVWGGVLAQAGRKEFENNVYDYLPHAPYVALHDIPSAITERIPGSHRDLVQLVRFCQTNLRPHDLICNPSRKEFVNPEQFAHADAAFIKYQLALAHEGKMIHVHGSFNDARFVDGLFTDKENFTVVPLNVAQSALFVNDLLCATHHLFLGTYALEQYFSSLSAQTGIHFNPMRPSVDEPLYRDVFLRHLCACLDVPLPSSSSWSYD